MNAVILRPLVNEKSMGLTKDGMYTFEVGKDATKQQIEKVVNHSAPSAEALLKRIVAKMDPENSARTAPDDVAAIAVRREEGQ